MPRFRIDCGNSSVGPVGFVAVVHAETKEKALEIFRKDITDTVEVETTDDNIDYFNVYLNGDGISIEDVEEDD